MEIFSKPDPEGVNTGAGTSTMKRATDASACTTRAGTVRVPSAACAVAHATTRTLIAATSVNARLGLEIEWVNEIRQRGVVTGGVITGFGSKSNGRGGGCQGSKGKGPRLHGGLSIRNSF